MVNRRQLRKNTDNIEHLMGSEKYRKLKKKQKKKIVNLLVVCLILTVASFCMAYFTTRDRRGGIIQFLGLSGPTFNTKGILVGLVSSTIFGMIDNGGLFFGMSALDPILPGDEIEKAGWGNTFSDFLGAFLGTFIGIFVKNMTGVEDTPIFSEVVGILIGCVLGIYIPKLLLKKGGKLCKGEQAKKDLQDLLDKKAVLNKLIKAKKKIKKKLDKKN
jgi:hypothetical protein